MFEGLIRFLRNQFFYPVEKESQPVKQEMLVRSQSYKTQYRKWTGHKRQSEILKNLYTSFTLSKLGITGDIPLHYFRDGANPHLIIHYIDPMGKDLFAFLQDYFRDKITRLGYNLYLSDRQTIERLGYVERIEKHVLRPYLPSFQSAGLREQLYGVLMVSVVYINERPLYLEVSSEIITDSHFNSPYPFDELADFLFT